jgi:hypothetical protein
MKVDHKYEISVGVIGKTRMKKSELWFEECHRAFRINRGRADKKV